MNIYLTFDREKKLREKARQEGVLPAALVANWIDGFDLLQGVVTGAKLQSSAIENSAPVKCDFPACRVESVGKFKVVTNDGMEETTKNLCTYHKTIAKREGELHEL